MSNNVTEVEYTEGELILNSFKALDGEMNAIDSLLELVSKNNQVEGNIILTDPRKYVYNGLEVIPAIINSDGIIEATITVDDKTYTLELNKSSVLEDVVDALLDAI